MVPPPTPFHILRAHQAPLSALHFSADNAHLFAGDQDGRVSVTDLGTRRVVASWVAHEGGVLSVGEWARGVVSQGRDNKIHFYRPLAKSATGGTGGMVGAGAAPEIVRSMDSNALNFCKFSLVSLGEEEGLLALPNLADSELIDIYHVPSLARVHAAINYRPRPKGPQATRSGIVMSVHLGTVADRAALAAGFEDGRVEVWACSLARVRSEWDGRKAGGAGAEPAWELLWEGKCHNEAVMAMAVDSGFTRAFTVSADHFLVRIDLEAVLRGKADEGARTAYGTKQIGHGAVALSADGRVVAAGGWDGRIRLFSAATFKPLGTLSFHRESVYAIAFAHAPSTRLLAPAEEVLEIGEESDSDEEEDAGERARWMASGGKDTRIALWALMDFGRGW